jgi:hypothetical protein
MSSVAPPSSAGTAVCANCGAALAGKYCSQCGQRHHDHPIHHFWHFIGEIAEDLTHADSRLWKTLAALLFRPGLLTREFLDGRRVRYLPPVRLYLVVSVIFFLISGLQSRLSNAPLVIVSKSGKSFHYQLVPAVAPAAAPARSPPAHRPADASAASVMTPAARQRLCEQSGQYIQQHGGWLASLGPRVRQNCLLAGSSTGLENLNEAVGHNLERAMFLFLPLLALVMKPLYRKPPRHYVEHLLFFVHNHAFLFVALGFTTLLQILTSSSLVLNIAGTAVAIYIPVYFYRAMRRVYAQGRWLTLGKLCTLGVAYFFLGLLMVLLTFSYTFLML